MTTRFIPVSIAIPLHLDDQTDSQLIERINHALLVNTKNEPMRASPLDPGQFVSAAPEAAKAVRNEVERQANIRRSAAAAAARTRKTERKRTARKAKAVPR